MAQTFSVHDRSLWRPVAKVSAIWWWKVSSAGTSGPSVGMRPDATDYGPRHGAGSGGGVAGGRVAVVTGAGSGIGRGIANGWPPLERVAVWEREADTCEAAAAEVDGLACVTDVREEEQVDVSLARTVADLGIPTILVNNAGGVFQSPSRAPSPRAGTP